jgi:hypothetical protein
VVKKALHYNFYVIVIREREGGEMRGRVKERVRYEREREREKE